MFSNLVHILGVVLIFRNLINFCSGIFFNTSKAITCIRSASITCNLRILKLRKNTQILRASWISNSHVSNNCHKFWLRCYGEKLVRNCWVYDFRILEEFQLDPQTFNRYPTVLIKISLGNDLIQLIFTYYWFWPRFEICNCLIGHYGTRYTFLFTLLQQ